MSKKKQKGNKECVVKYENSNISQEKMIEIQAEAYYRALKRIEDEKAKTEQESAEKKKYKWYENALFILNVFVCPWKIHKKFIISNRIYDNILVMLVSGAMKFIGGAMWLIGIVSIIRGIYQLFKRGFVIEIMDVAPIILSMTILGSILVLAGEEFGKETNSNKIYAYSASIIALISCVVGIITLIGM